MTNLQTILGTTKSYIDELKAAGINKVEDLLLYFPRTYESHNKGDLFSDLRGDQINYFKAKVCTKSDHPTKTGRNLYKCLIEDSEGALAECVWFVKPFFWGYLIEGKTFLFIGKAKLEFGKLQITSPKIELYGDTSVHTGDIVPVYSQIGEKLTSQWFREKIHGIIKYASIFEENLPKEVLEKEKLLNKIESIKQIHFPESDSLLKRAQERLAFEELFFLQRGALERKEEIQNLGKQENLVIKMNPELIKEFFASLPFTPTNAQKIAIYQILKDMEKPYPMHRLLEGDVGSGKTLVAMAAALAVLNGGRQVAFMAPTEVLARQHFSEVTKYMERFSTFNFQLSTFNLSPGLLIGAMTPKQKQEVLSDLQSGKINFLIGTHALISENVFFENLGLAIIDEQHKFGVMQREKLESHGLPHVLYMTATPIPRTLALIAYGDQDISVLNEMPAGRQKIDTKVVIPSGRHQVYRFIETEIEKGRQVYVICPLIEESEKLEVKAATDEYERLKNEVFPKYNIGLMHGRLASKDKEQVMKDFKEKKTQILISTTVVEVGVDVPNATIMIIEGAERFGLSQLHQLRGRVGRSEHKSYCFLFSTSGKSDIERLQSMEKYHDGFTLAEIDMKIRGPGEVYGLRQSGIPDLRMASMSDHQMVIRARKAAEEFLGMRGGM